MYRLSPEEQVIEILRSQKIDLAAVLPCDRLKRLLPLIERKFPTIKLTREENGIGICAGCYLGGGRPVMIIQSTGLGNMLNALLSLNFVYQIPLPIIASWRGVYKEKIPAQLPLGQVLPLILDASKIKYTIIESSNELDLINHIITDAYELHRPHIALIMPSVWEGSNCPPPPEPEAISPGRTVLRLSTQTNSPTISRYQAIESIVSAIDDEIIVSNIGVPCKELYHIKDRALNFYMLGSMGLASSIGLGLALMQNRHVVVIDGDGSLLMNPNILTQIAVHSPDNLTIAAMNNATYGSTGDQQTLTHSHIDLELMARGHGILSTAKIHTKDKLLEVYKKYRHRPGPLFMDIIIKPKNEPVADIPLSLLEIRERFMRAVQSA
ncbi:MAG: sulfopyruvate decarboxylase subunit beta [Methanosarcinales archaeon]